MPARSFARFMSLMRSSASAFRLSLSSSGGIGLNTASIAMSFASAKLTFNSCNSRSIPSNVRLDKSISRVFDGLHYRRFAFEMLRRSSQPAVTAFTYPALANSGRMWAHYAPNAKGLVETRLSGGLYIISPEMVAGAGLPSPLRGSVMSAGVAGLGMNLLRRTQPRLGTQK